MWNDTNPPSTGLYSQQLYACNYNSWYVTADMPADNKAVLTYPNVQETFSDVPVSQFGSLASNFAESGPGMASNDDYEFAYDMWLNGIATSTSDEVMIWNYNDGQTPSGSNVGTFSDGGITYQVYSTGSGEGHYDAFVAEDNYTSGSIDILAFYQYLIGRGIIPSSSTVDQIDYGIEICSTNSAPATFSVNNFSISSTS